MKEMAVGIFDSGFGGVSVLKAASALLPGEDFIYFGDHANLPYGDKTHEQIRVLSVAAAQKLVTYGVKAVVVACNTATSAAIKDIRARFNLPVVSMEPAVKPACAKTEGGSILVLATKGTIDQQRYQELVRREDTDNRVISVPCPSLADKIEWFAKDTRRFALAGEILDGYLSRFHGMYVSAMVLGCTHYVFLSRQIEEYARIHFPGAKLFDGNDGTARQLKRILAENDLLSTREKGRIAFHTSSDDKSLSETFDTLLNL